MRKLLVSIGMQMLTSYCFSQVNTSIYTEGVCACMDSSGGVQKSMIDCFAKSMDRNSAFWTQTLMEQGDTSQKAIRKLYDKLLFRVQIDLIGTCESFFRYTDSLNRFRDKYINKDSVKTALVRLNNIDESRRNRDYYKVKGNLFIQLGDYDNALKISDSLITKDSTDELGLLLKALVFDKKGDYEHSLPIYSRLLEMTKKDPYRLFVALTKRRIEEGKSLTN